MSTEQTPSDLGILFKKLAEEMAKNKNVVFDEDIVYPVTVNSFQAFTLKPTRAAIGGWAAVRPCADEYENKTFLGIYLGDLPVGQMTSFNPDTGAMAVVMKKNPGIFVPELKKIIYGMESWWSEIESPEDLKKITDQDIENVWYVKAMKDMAATETTEKENA